LTCSAGSLHIADDKPGKADQERATHHKPHGKGPARRGCCGLEINWHNISLFFNGARQAAAHMTTEPNMFPPEPKAATEDQICAFCFMGPVSTQQALCKPKRCAILRWVFLCRPSERLDIIAFLIAFLIGGI
jgi:hypothetical protein